MNKKVPILKKCIWIGVGIDVKPQDDLYPTIINLNQILKHQHGSTYNLSPTNPPHINLYDIDIPNKNLESVNTSLKEITKKRNHFSIKLTTINYFKYGAIFIECELNHELKELEKEVIEALVKYKGTCRTQDYWQPWRDYNDSQLKNRDKYGNPHVLDTFTPHITLGYIKANPSETKRVANKLKQKFIPTEIKVTQIDLAVQNEKGKFFKRQHFPFNRDE